jgi:V/A-type H+-transporting ATPase subunit F
VSSKAAVVGDADMVLLFRSAGFDGWAMDGSAEDEKQFTRLLKEDYTLIFIAEPLAEKWVSLLDRVRSQTFPMVVLIPGPKGSLGHAMKRVRETVKRAVGVDIMKEKKVRHE